MRLSIPNIFAKLFHHNSRNSCAPQCSGARQQYRELSSEKLHALRANFDAKSWDETADADRLAEHSAHRLIEQAAHA